MKYLIGAILGITLFCGAADYYNVKNNYNISNGWQDFFFSPTLGLAEPLNGGCESEYYDDCNKLQKYISKHFYKGKNE